ncbi:hypothetical protein ACMATS_22200 [Streptoverticillium reticulum]|uniref:hypothetical protein n=1 Tax=Streptoverticillium reticulum TaxID=1433415 RepID=UPI0039BF190F
MSKIVENISELFSRDHRVPVSDADEMIVSARPTWDIRTSPQDFCGFPAAD